MHKFKIEIAKVTPSNKTFTVRANNSTEAKRKALALIGNEEFTTYDDTVVCNIIEVKKSMNRTIERLKKIIKDSLKIK